MLITPVAPINKGLQLSTLEVKMVKNQVIRPKTKVLFTKHLEEHNPTCTIILYKLRL